MRDKLLVIGLKNSSEKAFNKLFEIYYPKIKAFLFSLNLNHSYEDVIQETFITVWNKRAFIKIDKSFDSYVFTIAKNYALKSLRKQLSNDIEATDLDFQDTSVRADELFDSMYYRDKLESSLQKLPPKPKTVYTLKRQNGLSTKQVAAELDIAPKTVENYMTMALHFLKKELEHIVR